MALFAMSAVCPKSSNRGSRIALFTMGTVGGGWCILHRRWSDVGDDSTPVVRIPPPQPHETEFS